MRHRLTLAAVVAGAFSCYTGSWSTPARAQADQVANVLTAARQALGGESRVAAVKTFIANGRTRQVRGNNLVPIEFEIQVELPDKYSRRDEFPAQDAGPVTAGFNGDTPIQNPAPPAGGRAGAPPPTPEQMAVASRTRLAAVKQDFARLTLGMFASSYSGYPLEFKYAGQAEAPQGKADVLEVSGPEGFMARLFVDSQTHLPLMVTWQARTPPGPQRSAGPRGAAPPGRGAAPDLPPGQQRGAPAPPGSAGPREGPPGALPPENRLYFADYRDVDGLKLPFRLRRAVGSETTEETTFDRFRINARTDPRRFQNEQ